MGHNVNHCGLQVWNIAFCKNADNNTTHPIFFYQYKGSIVPLCIWVGMSVAEMMRHGSPGWIIKGSTAVPGSVSDQPPHSEVAWSSRSCGSPRGERRGGDGGPQPSAGRARSSRQHQPASQRRTHPGAGPAGSVPQLILPGAEISLLSEICPGCRSAI